MPPTIRPRLAVLRGPASCGVLQGPLPNWDKNVHYVMSHDFFKSAHEKLASCGNQFDIIARKVIPALTPSGELAALRGPTAHSEGEDVDAWVCRCTWRSPATAPTTLTAASAG